MAKNHRRILLIEDSPADVRLIRESLREALHERFTVITASTLAQGLRTLARNDVDAVLLDLALPDSQGIDTFHAIVQHAPFLPVIVLTTTDDDALGQRMVQEGAQDYLPKDVLPRDTCTATLTRTIGYAIGRKRADVALQQEREKVQSLNERLRSANEELFILNEELQHGIQESTEELKVTTEELRVTNEELASSNEDLRASSRYVRSLIEVSLDPLVTISADGTITDVNKATEAVTGCSRDELIGSDFSTYFTEPEKAKAVYKQVSRDGFVRDYALAIRHKSGRVTDVLYNAAVYRDEAGEVLGVFAAARDVTDRKRAEQELQRYSGHLEELVEERTAQLRDSERLAAIGQTATMIGHDLRNPLQALQFTLELERKYFDTMPSAARTNPDAQKAVQLFSNMEQQIQYMDKIVSDLQDYARPLTPEREEVNVAALINDTLSVLTIPESIHMQVNVSTSFKATVDPHLMQRVLSNLTTNALQAMPEGGTLTISASANDSAVVITVQDTGKGVPENMKDTLFSPLTTGKAKGTGLGLAVVKRIVDAHGGDIAFRSEDGKGTTFTVRLPTDKRHAHTKGADEREKRRI